MNRAFGSIAALLVFVQSADAIDFDGGGDGVSYEDALNWSTDTIPSTGDDARIVTSGDSVNISSSRNTSGNLEIGAAGAGATLWVNVGGELLQIDRLNVGGSAGETGTLTLNGGSVTANYDPTDNNRIGGAGTGRAYIQHANSTLSATQANLVLGYEASGYGEVNHSAGTLAVSGNNNLVVSRLGPGVYNNTGGTLSIAGTGDLIVGNLAGSFGTVNMSGAASMDLNDNAVIGNQGEGRLAMSGNSTTDVRLDMNIGQANGANGVASLWDNSEVTVGRVTRVGSPNGSIGNLFMQGDSVWNQTGGDLRIGQTAGSSGTMQMRGNSILNQNVGQLKPGTQSTGHMEMFDNSQVLNGSVSIGHSGTSADGTMVLNQSARVDVGLSQSNIGNQGTGQLTLNDDSEFRAGGTRSISIGNDNTGQGTVIINDNATLSSGGAMFLGQQEDTRGTIIQNGANSRVETRSSNLVVGRQGTAQGTYIMNDGIASAAFDLYVGRANSSVGFFQQNGGEVIVGNNLLFGNGANASVGTYQMTGGILTIANEMRAAAAGTFLLQGGILRVDTLASSIDDFQWGAGELASRQEADAAELVSNIDLTTSSGSHLNLGDTYISAFVDHETLTVNGTLDLSASGDIFTAIGSVQLLRTLGHGSRAGRVPLVSATSLIGQFDTFNGPVDSFVSESLFDPLGDENALEVDTWFLDYDGNDIYFLYKISNTVPEPSTVGFLGVALIFLRGLARKRYRYMD